MAEPTGSPATTGHCCRGHGRVPRPAQIPVIRRSPPASSRSALSCAFQAPTKGCEATVPNRDRSDIAQYREANQVTEHSFDGEQGRHIVLPIFYTRPRAMGAWWLPVLFVGTAIACAAVEYGGLLSH